MEACYGWNDRVSVGKRSRSRGNKGTPRTSYVPPLFFARAFAESLPKDSRLPPMQPVSKSRTQAASSRKLNVAQPPAARNIAISSSYMARRLCKLSRSVCSSILQRSAGARARVSKVLPRSGIFFIRFSSKTQSRTARILQVPAAECWIVGLPPTSETRLRISPDRSIRENVHGAL